jgi:hypothetical protein
MENSDTRCTKAACLSNTIPQAKADENQGPLCAIHFLSQLSQRFRTPTSS